MTDISMWRPAVETYPSLETITHTHECVEIGGGEIDLFLTNE